MKERGMTFEAKNTAVEARRLVRLKSYGLLDEQEYPVLSQYTQMAAQIAGTPMAMVKLIDADWQFTKGEFGTAGLIDHILLNLRGRAVDSVLHFPAPGADNLKSATAVCALVTVTGSVD